MLKFLIVLIALFSVTRAQAVVFSEEQLNAVHMMEQSIDGVVSGGKKAVSLRITQLEVQLMALKAAKVVSTDEGMRYSAVLVGAGATAGAAALTAFVIVKILKTPFLSRYPAAQIVMASLIGLGGMYEVGVLAGETSLLIVLTEDQLVDMIKRVENRIQELKRA